MQANSCNHLSGIMEDVHGILCVGSCIYWQRTHVHTHTAFGLACATSTKAPSAPASRSRVQSRARGIWHSSLPMKYFTSAALLSLKSGQSSLWTSLSQVALTHSEPGAARIIRPFCQERVGLVRKISTSDPTSAKMVEILGVAELAFEPHDTDIACYCIS